MKTDKPRFTGRLARWHEISIYLSFASLLVSGLAWLVLHNYVQVEGPFGPEHHPAEPWLLRFHGVATYFFLVLVGALLPLHIRLAWSARRNLTTGLATATAMILLAISGIGLYYLSGEKVRAWTSILHWGVGILAMAVLTWHAVLGRR